MSGRTIIVVQRIMSGEVDSEDGKVVVSVRRRGMWELVTLKAGSSIVLTAEPADPMILVRHQDE